MITHVVIILEVEIFKALGEGHAVSMLRKYVSSSSPFFPGSSVIPPKLFNYHYTCRKINECATGLSGSFQF